MSPRSNHWYVFGEYPGLPWFSSCYNEGLASDLADRAGVSLDHFAVAYFQEKQIQFLYGNEWAAIGQQYFQKVLTNPSILQGNLTELYKAADNLYNLNKEFLSKKWDAASLSELESNYIKFHQAQHLVWSIAMVPNLLELEQSYLSDYLYAYLKEKSLNKLSWDEWQTLITSSQLSATQKEERALLQLALDIKEDKIVPENKLPNINTPADLSAQLQKNAKYWQRIISHHNSFCWIQYGWTGPGATLNYYLERLLKLLKNGNAKKRLNQLSDENKQLQIEQTRLESSLPLDSKHKLLLTLLRQLLFSKAYRMDALFQGYFAMKPILNGLAKHYNLTREQIFMIHGEDMLNALKQKKLTRQNLQDAMEFSCFIKENNKLPFYFGETAKAKFAPILADIQQETASESLKGQVAFNGFAKGQVKIILTARDIPKVNSGDILISYATDPSLLPAMEKASAFVTDEGGITCHAAIVARELKKPCIIGTKIATQILKDGDMVEVDANKGIVKIIERNK